MNKSKKGFFDTAVTPNGFRNTGVICYFNSLLQVLLSSPVLNDCILNYEEPPMTENEKKETALVVKDKPTSVSFKLLNMFLRKTLNNDPKVKIKLEHFSYKILHSVMLHVKKNNPKHRFGNSQEDANEGLLFLLDSLQNKTHEKLQRSKIKVSLVCMECNAVVSKKEEEIMQFYVNENYKKQKCELFKHDNDMIQYIRNNECIVEGYNCGDCGKKVKVRKVEQLINISSVLIVVFKKYLRKYVVDFPASFSLGGINNQLNYVLVGQVEHYGGRSGGHYTARGLRKDGKVYLFNDNNVSEVEGFQSTPNTYMIVYQRY